VRAGTAPGRYARELAYAKLNLVLHVGRPRDDGMHPLCSLLASIDLADDVEVRVRDADADADLVVCPGVEGPNLATGALSALRGHVTLPPLEVRIHKRIPVAAGLGGGSADAAAVLRAANRLAGEPLDPSELRTLGAGLGSDVPSQVEPRHALVQGTGELVEPIELPPLAAVLVPQPEGLATNDVYAELDRRGGWRERLDPAPLRRLAASPPERLAAGLENDLQPPGLALRPDLEKALSALRGAGSLGAAMSGSGATCFGLFTDPGAARRAAERIGGALPARLRAG
jgi:4-diphosphocytidyl-2-C-methyl-D-erythritol kinase